MFSYRMHCPRSCPLISESPLGLLSIPALNVYNTYIRSAFALTIDFDFDAMPWIHGWPGGH